MSALGFIIVLALFGAARYAWARAKLRWRVKTVMRAIEEERRRDKRR